jgi:superfamily II DNA or RNA helicase
MKIIMRNKLNCYDLSDEERIALKRANQWPDPENELEVLKVWEQRNGEIIIPIGYLGELLRKFDVTHGIDDRVKHNAKFPELRGVVLRDYQTKALEDIGEKRIGIIEAVTGAGKTITVLELIKRRKQRTIILMHSRTLLEQWRQIIFELMGFEPGVVGGGEWNEGELITLGTFQSLHKSRDRAQELASGYGCLVIEEAHHAAATTYAEVIGWFPSWYRYSVTATPHLRNGLDDLLYRHVGPILTEVTASAVEATGSIVPVTVKVLKSGFEPFADSWVEYISQITEDTTRNQLIIQTARRAAESHQTLILSDRVAHVETLAEMLGDECLAIHGKLKTKERSNYSGVISINSGHRLS